MIEAIARFWCRLVHDEPMLPIHGHYKCRICSRLFPVRWEAK